MKSGRTAASSAPATYPKRPRRDFHFLASRLACAPTPRCTLLTTTVLSSTTAQIAQHPVELLRLAGLGDLDLRRAAQDLQGRVDGVLLVAAGRRVRDEQEVVHPCTLPARRSDGHRTDGEGAEPRLW